MTLLLTKCDLRPLLTEPVLIERGLAAIAESLTTTDARDDASHVWIAFPLAERDARLNLNVLTTMADATSLRIWPTARGTAAEHAMTVLFDRAEGRPVAIMGNGPLLMWRTAGAVVLACRHLAPAGTRTLALIGSSVQARYHLIGLRQVLPTLREIRVYSRDRTNRERYARWATEATGLPVASVDSAEHAVTGADVVCNTSGSTVPVFDPAWVEPGALVTEIFLGVPRELPARVVVPTDPVATRTIADYAPHPEAQDHAVAPADATLADVISGRARARLRDDDIVVFRLHGNYPFDAALTAFAYQWAVDNSIGTSIEL